VLLTRLLASSLKLSEFFSSQRKNDESLRDLTGLLLSGYTLLKSSMYIGADEFFLLGCGLGESHETGLMTADDYCK